MSLIRSAAITEMESIFLSGRNPRRMNWEQMNAQQPHVSSESQVTQFYREEPASGSPNEKFNDVIPLTSLESLSEDLERVLNPDSSCFADVILKCDDFSIPTHKVILSARSPVFAAMFANPMNESCKNEVDITDIDESVLRDLLLYIYTGKTHFLTVKSTADLLYAADKYQVQELKAECIHFLKNTVTPQNVWNFLVLGERHSEDLKSFAIDYICRECGEFSVIEKNHRWTVLRKMNPDLAMDLLESMVKYRDENMKSCPNSTNRCQTVSLTTPSTVGQSYVSSTVGQSSASSTVGQPYRFGTRPAIAKTNNGSPLFLK